MLASALVLVLAVLGRAASAHAQGTPPVMGAPPPADEEECNWTGNISGCNPVVGGLILFALLSALVALTICCRRVAQRHAEEEASQLSTMAVTKADDEVHISLDFALVDGKEQLIVVSRDPEPEENGEVDDQEDWAQWDESLVVSDDGMGQRELVPRDSRALDADPPPAEEAGARGAAADPPPRRPPSSPSHPLSQPAHDASPARKFRLPDRASSYR